MIKTFLALSSLLFSFSTFAQVAFQDSATTLGINYTYGSSFYGGGVSFADFDSDGWDDLTFSTSETSEILFFKNNLGTFTLVDLGINDTNKAKQVLWVDYDNDGDRDFFTTSYQGVNKFYRNDGNLSFTDITNTCGLFTNDYYSFGVTFGDIDNDGDLDVFISNRDETNFTQRNYLYRNDNGTFVDITNTNGIFMGSELTFCSAFFDYDNDNDLDLYLANDKQFINRLYQNDGNGSFTDVSASSGAGITIDAMSTTIGDYNNDGWFDIYVSNTDSGNALLHNNGDGTFTDVAATTNTEFNSIGWGCTFLDADNDTDLDLYVSSHMTGVVAGYLPSAFYENNGANVFNIPEGVGFENDNKPSFSNAIGDFNNDGYPDIVVMNDTENYFLWENLSQQNTANNWLKVNLEGITNNKDGIGAKIEITINGNNQYRFSLCGEGYLGQNSFTEFFGLGQATTVDTIIVTWPNGVIDTFTNVAANQSLNITEGQPLHIDKAISQDNYPLVFPNPANNTVYVSNLKTNSEFKLYSILGHLVYKGELLPNSTNTIDVSTYKSGVYMISISNDNQTFSRKLVID